MIDQSAIDAIRTQTDLVMLIGPTVPLKKRGNIWFGLCPNHKEKTPSFKVDNQRHTYKCFGCGFGGDAIEWVQWRDHIGFPEAVAYLSNGAVPHVNGHANGHDAATQPKRVKAEFITPVPADVEPPDFHHYRHGKPTTVWTYRNAAGEVMYYVARYDPEGEKKQFSPWSYTTKGWAMKGLPPPRPLFGLRELAERPEAPVLIVEGEKTAMAARKLLPEYVCVTWHGGTSAPQHTDWGPLKGRTLVCWPDNDDVGLAAMKQVCKLAKVAGRILTPPAGVDKGFDAADATAEQALEMLKGPLPADAPPEPEPPVEPPVFDPAMASRDWPFGLLGHRNGTYFYLPNAGGTVIALGGASHSKNALLMLARLSFWETEFSAFDKKGYDMVANALIIEQHKQGIYDPTRLRGRGAWWDEGRVVVHIGDRLVVDGEIMPIKDFKTEFLYEVSPKIRYVEAKPLGNADANKLVDLCKLLNWERPLSAYLLAGWIALAPVCGALKWRSNVFLTGVAGSGKAQPLSSGILTQQGWRKMGDLRVGDVVSTPDDKAAVIRAVYPQGKVPVFKIVFSDGRATRATADHLWKVRISHQWRLRTTAEMAEIMQRENRASRSLAIPLCEPMRVAQNNRSTPLVHPYVLGALLGDGHFGNARDAGKRHYGNISLTSYDDWVIDRVRAMLPTGMKLFQQKTTRTWRLGDAKVWGRNTRQVFRGLGLDGVRSHTKFIPPDYLAASIDDRFRLLQGLMDTDGTVGVNGGTTFCTTSPRLAGDVCSLVRSLGGIAMTSLRSPTYTYDGEKKNGRTAYVVNIRMSDRRALFTLPRKLERLPAEWQYGDCLYLNVESIEPDGEEECQCIAIDDPNRLYVTDDYIVTHNTWIYQNIICKIVGPAGYALAANVSEPGIRRTLGSDAMPVMIDELEARDVMAAQRIEAIMGLMRYSSSETDAMIVKGSNSGAGVEFFKIRSMFCTLAIGSLITDYADASRTSVLSLKAVHGMAGELKFQAIEDMQRALLTEAWIDGLRTRIIRAIPTIRHNAEVFSAAGAKVLGTRRLGDQLGTLLAGAYALSSTQRISPEKAQEWLEQQDWSEEKEIILDTDGPACFARIMEHQVMCEVATGGGHVRRSMGELMTIVAKRTWDGSVSYDTAVATARRSGLVYQDGFVVVSNTHSEVAKILYDTPWSANWHRRLKSIKGAESSKAAVSYGTSVTRAILVPWRAE